MDKGRLIKKTEILNLFEYFNSLKDNNEKVN